MLDEQAPPPPSEIAGGVPRHGGRGEEHGLADEHAVLQKEVGSRERALRAALGAGNWPTHEIASLVDYLRYEVLDQAATSERLLFPLVSGGFTDSRIHRLVGDHVRLRDLTDQLANAATADGPHREPQDLEKVVDALHELLDRHMREEEAVLSSATRAGVESFRQPFRCHLWFPLTEGPAFDLDALPREFAQRAALERFSRLRPGKSLQVRAGRGLDDLWSALACRWPGEYGWAYLEEGPDQWLAEVTRRAPE